MKTAIFRSLIFGLAIASLMFGLFAIAYPEARSLKVAVVFAIICCGATLPLTHAVGWRGTPARRTRSTTADL